MEKRIIKVLYVNGGIMDRGGVSSVMMNYYSHIDPMTVKIDFLVHGLRTGVYDKEILEKGSKIYRVVPKSKNLIQNYKEIKKIILSGEYDIVHAHADSGNAYILKIAKECGVKVRISHSHNTNYTIENKVRIFLNNIQKQKIKKYATDLWACSKLAAKWLYGKEGNVYIVNNAIEMEKYQYNENCRSCIRKEYNLMDNFVVGMVGRLGYQKNHDYAIDIISSLKKYIPKVKLVICGDGELKAELIQKINEKKVQNETLLTGQVDNVDEFYSAFDVLIMPSRFEGLPVSIVEAQCNGLPCVLSNKITKEVKITNNIVYLPIKSTDIEQWCRAVIEAKRNSISKEEFIKSGFDIESEAKKITKKYCSLVNLSGEK